MNEGFVNKDKNKMLRNFKNFMLFALLAAVVTGTGNLQAKDTPNGAPGSPARIAQEARHELIMLPYYGVFDNLEFRVDGSTLTLLGEVTRPTLKSDAARVVKGIEGVQTVNNQIKVLPLSPMDDQIRLAVYRAVYRQPVLSQYALRAVPTIHIIVENGHVTLEGAVARQADKNIAGIKANGVFGVFSVTNNLQVD